jgi:hypothetical protein
LMTSEIRQYRDLVYHGKDHVLMFLFASSSGGSGTPV